jgi:small conductance mechanosensitive channel
VKANFPGRYLVNLYKTLPAALNWETVKQYLNEPAIRIALIAVGGLVAVMFFRFVTRRIVRRIERPCEEEKREWELRAKTLARITNNFISIAIVTVGVFLILSEVGIQIGPLLAAAGIAGLAIGFGAQSLVKDFLSGFFILLENQYRVGDVVKIGELSGVVEKMTLRITALRDLQGVVHFIPNGEIKSVSNMTYQWSRMLVEVGVAYKESVDRVIETLKTLCAEFYADEPWNTDLLEEPQVAGVEALADSQVTIRVMAKTKPLKQWDAMREFRRRVKNRFDELGIEIPFPQRTVHVREEKGGGDSGSAAE